MLICIQLLLRALLGERGEGKGKGGGERILSLTLKNGREDSVCSGLYWEWDG